MQKLDQSKQWPLNCQLLIYIHMYEFKLQRKYKNVTNPADNGQLL